MTNASSLRYHVGSWARNFVSVRAVSEALAAFGGLWLLYQIATYFLPDDVNKWLQTRWWLFLGVGFGAAIFRCRPRTSFVHNVAGRDVTIEIAVGDVFQYPGALVVGSNTTFDTEVSERLIAETSVQGTFTRRYCDSVSQLDTAIEAQLKDVPNTLLEGERVGKSTRYAVGTVARVNQGGRVAYFLALAHINEHGSAQGDLAGLREALGSLWWFAGERGAREPLVTPVLGSGFARLVQKRELIVREIVTSFVAACSEKVFTDRLTVVLSPQDVHAHRVSLDSLNEYVRHVCRYSGFAASDAEQVGSAVS